MTIPLTPEAILPSGVFVYIVFQKITLVIIKRA